MKATHNVNGIEQLVSAKCRTNTHEDSNQMKRNNVDTTEDKLCTILK